MHRQRPRLQWRKKQSYGDPEQWDIYEGWVRHHVYRVSRCGEFWYWTTGANQSRPYLDPWSAMLGAQRDYEEQFCGPRT